MGATIPYPDSLANATTARRGLLWLLLLLVALLAAAGCGGISNPRGWAAPELVGDALYASIDPGKMAALDPSDMTVRWIFPPDTKEGKRLKLEGIYAPPIVEGGRLYFGAYDGFVYALDAASGSEVWRFDTGGPVVGRLAFSVDKTVIFAASDSGKLFGLDAASGALKVGPFDAGASILAGPLVDGEAVYVASVNGKLYKLDSATLSVTWIFKASAGLLMDPTLVDGDTILVGGIDHKVRAVDANSGEERWAFGGSNWFWGRPLVDGGTIYLPSLDHNVYALDLAAGSLKWKLAMSAPVRSAPLLAGGVLLVIDKDGNAFGLDPETGQKRWGPTEIGTTVLSDPILFGDKVLVMAQGGGLHSINPADGALAKVEVKR